MFDYSNLGNLVQAIVEEHHHAHNVMSYTEDDLEFQGAYTAWITTRHFLITATLSNEILPLTEDMGSRIEHLDESRLVYQSLF